MADDDFENKDFSPEAAVDPQGPNTEYGREYVPPFHGFGDDPQNQVIQELERRIRELEEKMTPLQRIETSAGGEADYENDRVIIDVDEQEDERAPAESEPQSAPRRVLFQELTVTTEPYPSEQDITDSIEAAISGEDPEIGDVIALTRDTGAIVVLKYELREVPSGQGDVGLFVRLVDEGADTFLAIGEETGGYA